MVDEIGPITAIGALWDRAIGRQQPPALMIINGDAAELRHQRLLAVDQRTDSLDLHRATAFGFQTLNQPQQQQRALPHDAFGIGGKRLGQVQAMHVHFRQRTVAGRQDFPNRQRSQGTADHQQQQHHKTGITLHVSTLRKSGFRSSHHSNVGTHRGNRFQSASIQAVCAGCSNRVCG